MSSPVTAPRPSAPAAATLHNGELFSSSSMMRQFNQESLLLLGGGRAVLLQLAHPLVAAGVADHSEFQADPLARLFGTLDLMHTLVFGSGEQVRSRLRDFHAIHARVSGALDEGAGRFPSKTSYRAGDPRLKLWVYATLVDSSLLTYQQFVSRLTPDQRASYYADTLVLARQLGISDANLPSTLTDFKAYMGAMLAGDTLHVTDDARRLAWSVLNPQVGAVQAASARLLRFVTAGLLPKRFRTAFGLSWGPRRQRLLDGFGGATRLLRPVAPGWLWQSPHLDGPSLVRLLLWPSRQSLI